MFIVFIGTSIMSNIIWINGNNNSSNFYHITRKFILWFNVCSHQYAYYFCGSFVMRACVCACFCTRVCVFDEENEKPISHIRFDAQWKYVGIHWILCSQTETFNNAQNTHLIRVRNISFWMKSFLTNGKKTKTSNIMAFSLSLFLFHSNLFSFPINRNDVPHHILNNKIQKKNRQNVLHHEGWQWAQAKSNEKKENPLRNFHFTIFHYDSFRPCDVVLNVTLFNMLDMYVCVFYRSTSGCLEMFVFFYAISNWTVSVSAFIYCQINHYWSERVCVCIPLSFVLCVAEMTMKMTDKP